MTFRYFLSMLILSMLPVLTYAQKDTHNDESKVPNISLPDLFVNSKGQEINTIQEWEYKRRPEIVNLFENNVYGTMPKAIDALNFTIVNEDKMAMNGMATLKEIDIEVIYRTQSATMRLILFIPNERDEAAPVFLLINHRDPENIDPTRTIKMGFWPAEEIVRRGYAAATFHVKDVADDDKVTFTDDILSKLYPEELEKENGMRGLGAWAWGAMRAMDYFETCQDIDAKKAAVIGHSRGGKASLWTGASDPRWAITISNESGAGGAAISRRKFGETVQRINTVFPYWFTDNFNKYNNNEALLPIDQHMLIAAMAPRAVYVASASEDLWADPKGEYMSLQLGTRVHREIYKMKGDFPKAINSPGNPVHLPYAGHHIREGKHNLTPYDWNLFMDFADNYFRFNNE
ncbi:glucuronyl esterase domain-containing protein [Cyclobacterium marinum]|uniref:Putative acetyl xylan esterase n=1 Tax=Cyclobacterium marinum (strain ATCC 25205 / DSM 745 / LMG 13164 / NCIMB 1802) TaxID=880070 RepID=G0J341_CYCMS|nr:alpha/beta hydrolase [Cyclobacterium marinum]AEL28337.1 putative acetyl xylan esterase [Cyclobacterium marinum DSM 745]